MCWCGVGGAGSEWCAGVVLVVLEVSGVLVCYHNLTRCTLTASVSISVFGVYCIFKDMLPWSPIHLGLCPLCVVHQTGGGRCSRSTQEGQ